MAGSASMTDEPRRPGSAWPDAARLRPRSAFWLCEAATFVVRRRGRAQPARNAVTAQDLDDAGEHERNEHGQRYGNQQIPSEPQRRHYDA